MQHSQMKHRPTVYVLWNCACFTLMYHTRTTLNRHCSCSEGPVSQWEQRPRPPMFWPWHHLSETLPCDITLLPGTTRMSSDTQQSQVPPLPRLVRGLGETPQPTSSFIWLSLDCSTDPLPIPICIRLIKTRQEELCEWHWSILLLPRETIQVVTHNCGEGRWVQKIKGVDRWLNKEWQKGTGRKWE